MIDRAAERRRVLFPVLVATVAAWAFLLSSSTGHSDHSPALSVTKACLASIPMLIAMMAPTLIEPLRHIHRRSFARRRSRSMALFLMGYAAVWMVLTAAFMSVARSALEAGLPSFLPPLALLIVAVVWQCSPLKQLGLNRCHAHAELAPFGIAADVDAGRFGIEHGFWCAASCWPWMSGSMLLPYGQTAAMAIATYATLGERLESPAPLRWRLRGPARLTRLMLTQARLRLSPPARALRRSHAR